MQEEAQGIGIQTSLGGIKPWLELLQPVSVGLVFIGSFVAGLSQLTGYLLRATHFGNRSIKDAVEFLDPANQVPGGIFNGFATLNMLLVALIAPIVPLIRARQRGIKAEGENVELSKTSRWQIGMAALLLLMFLLILASMIDFFRYLFPQYRYSWMVGFSAVMFGVLFGYFFDTVRLSMPKKDTWNHLVMIGFLLLCVLTVYIFSFSIFSRVLMRELRAELGGGLPKIVTMHFVKEFSGEIDAMQLEKAEGSGTSRRVQLHFAGEGTYFVSTASDSGQNKIHSISKDKVIFMTMSPDSTR